MINDHQQAVLRTKAKHQSFGLIFGIPEKIPILFKSQEPSVQPIVTTKLFLPYSNWKVTLARRSHSI